MNLNRLEYFVAAAEELNFTRAAERMFISQTAMTQQIRALEEHIGVPLFTRDHHHVELTAAGRVYLNEARIILERSGEAERLARLVSEGTEGELSVGYISGYGLADLAEKLGTFHQAFPNIRIRLVRGNLIVLLKQLQNREIDVMFAISRTEHAQGLTGLYLESFPVYAVLPAGHVLGNRRELRYRDLKEEAFIMMQPSNRVKESMEEAVLIYERGGYIPKVVAAEGDPETLFLMISMGLGISLLPEYVTRSFRDKENVRILPMVKDDGSAETVNLELGWLSDNPNPAIPHLLETVGHKSGSI